MNKIQFIAKSFQVLCISSLILSGLWLSSCNKESVTLPPIAEPTRTIFDHPDATEDLVAVLNPLDKRLYALPGYLEIALEMLQAFPQSDGTYVMEGITPLKKPVRIVFEPVEVEIPLLLNLVSDSDNTRPDLIHEFEDKGTKYRVYKNADCGGLVEDGPTDCVNEEDGTSYKYEWRPFKHCIRGTGFCTEAYAVDGRRIIYLNQNCQGLIKDEEPHFNWQCV